MQINDCILAATGGPTVNDGLAAYYGKTADESLNDAEYRWLGEQGATALQLNDRWFEFLTGRGYVGSLNDMKETYWCDAAGGTNPIPVQSFISDDLATTIYVIFDQLMLGTDADNLLAMTLRVNDVIQPLSALGLNGQPSTQLGMVLVTAVLPGDVVTWEYDPAIGDLRTSVGDHELDAGVYPVDNQVGVLTHNGEVVTYNGDPVYKGA